MKSWLPHSFKASICKTQISNFYTAFRSSCYFLLDQNSQNLSQMRSTINNINWSSYDLSTVLFIYKMLCRYSSTCKRRAQFSGIQHFLTQTWVLRPSELNAEQEEATLSNLPLNVSRNHKKLTLPAVLSIEHQINFLIRLKKKKGFKYSNNRHSHY